LQLTPQQDAEKARQRRSRIAQKLNVPKRTPRLFARCGLADGLFEHPALRVYHLLQTEHGVKGKGQESCLVDTTSPISTLVKREVEDI
jgi:hypothetical protein